MDSLSLKIPLSTLSRVDRCGGKISITWSFFFPPGTLYLIICVGFPRLSCSARTFWICVHLVSAGVCIWTQVSAMPHTHHCVPLPIPLGPCSMSWGVAMICVCAYGVCLAASGTCRLQCLYCICLELELCAHYHTHYKCCGSLKCISHALERSLFPATPVAIKLAGHPRFPFLWVLTYLGIYTINYGYVNIKWHFYRIISRCQRSLRG